MKKFIITIARTYGSGGLRIAKRLSEELGIKYYDRELIRKASEDTGIKEALFNLADETHKKRLFKKYTSQEIKNPDDSDYLSNENLFNMQAKVIREIAAMDESCIIVGRCSNYILKDDPCLISLFIHGDLDSRIRNVKELNGVTDDEALELINRFDGDRARYYKYFTGTEWSDVENYDLCVDTSKMNMDQCVNLILSFIKVIQELED